ncbi:methyltransferase-domain-containing protein [Cerioporus squamosus]|nr:methyltransferase-domain-containing protein [Cerioporus squamosus]
MSLFEVPGWSVPAAPVAQSSKKRKRPAAKESDDVDEAERIHAAQKNIEKLMRSLGEGVGALDGESSGTLPKKQKKKHEGKEKARRRRTSRGRGRSSKEGGMLKRSRNDAPAGPSSPTKQNTIPAPGKSKKKQKRKQARAESANAGSDAESIREPLSVAPATTPGTPGAAHKGKSKDGEQGLTALQAGLKKKLDGARFRWINEVLYKSDSGKAHEIMSQDPAVFADYHVGFRHQVESWPTNPVAHYISTLSSYSAKTVIADLGCGDAALARALVPKGMTVLSFDLVADGAYVVEADTCSRVPLPGSEPVSSGGKSDGEGQVVDVVVCALSLMGTNWPGCIREAWRILRSGGELKVAEVTSRFTDADDFVSFVSSLGFKLQSKDERNTHFALFEFKKVPRQPIADKDWTKLLSRGNILKPCEYKRR